MKFTESEVFDLPQVLLPGKRVTITHRTGVEFCISYVIYECVVEDQNPCLPGVLT